MNRSYSGPSKHAAIGRRHKHLIQPTNRVDRRRHVVTWPVLPEVFDADAGTRISAVCDFTVIARGTNRKRIVLNLRKHWADFDISTFSTNNVQFTFLFTFIPAKKCLY